MTRNLRQEQINRLREANRVASLPRNSFRRYLLQRPVLSGTLVVLGVVLVNLVLLAIVIAMVVFGLSFII